MFINGIRTTEGPVVCKGRQAGRNFRGKYFPKVTSHMVGIVFQVKPKSEEFMMIFKPMRYFSIFFQRKNRNILL